MSSGRDPAFEDEIERFLAAHHRSELTALRFELEEQRRRSRRRTAWLAVVSALCVLMGAVVVDQALHGDLLERVAGLLRQLGIV